MKVELVPIEVLRPHEQVVSDKVDQLERMTLRWKAYTKPLLIDRKTGSDPHRHPMQYSIQR